MSHKVTVEELDAWLKRDDQQMAASSHSAFSQKTLSVTSFTHTFVVTDHGKETYRGRDMEAAVAAYNSAR